MPLQQFASCIWDVKEVTYFRYIDLPKALAFYSFIKLNGPVARMPQGGYLEKKREKRRGNRA